MLSLVEGNMNYVHDPQITKPLLLPNSIKKKKTGKKKKTTKKETERHKATNNKLLGRLYQRGAYVPYIFKLKAAHLSGHFESSHMQSFAFQMKQLLEQVKCRENDFKVSFLLSTNRGTYLGLHVLSITW